MCDGDNMSILHSTAHYLQQVLTIRNKVVTKLAWMLHNKNQLTHAQQHVRNMYVMFARTTDDARVTRPPGRAHCFRDKIETDRTVHIVIE